MEKHSKSQLNLPKFEFKIKKKNSIEFIFDEVRKKYIHLTPEEWVRQNFLKYLNAEKKYPMGLFSLEKSFKINGLQKRADIVAHNRYGEPALIVECKSPEVNINDATFEQISRYNLMLKVTYLVVTNGMEHYCCKVDLEKKNFDFLTEIPHYEYIN